MARFSRTVWRYSADNSRRSALAQPFLPGQGRRALFLFRRRMNMKSKLKITTGNSGGPKTATPPQPPLRSSPSLTNRPSTLTTLNHQSIIQTYQPKTYNRIEPPRTIRNQAFGLKIPTNKQAAHTRRINSSIENIYLRCEADPKSSVSAFGEASLVEIGEIKKFPVEFHTHPNRF